MLGPRSFGITVSNLNDGKTGHGAQTAFAGVVSIANEHLEMAPESLLAIQSPDGEVIPLTSWPKPSVTALKVALPGICHFINIHKFLLPSPSINICDCRRRWQNVSPHQVKLASRCHRTRW